ncbi:MAG: NAD(P)H-dependent oxidoreductase subunit E [Clostridiales bacterium]|jgi:NADH:ubiquinone oxidoreductase subunit E|nr:NAD(P)H-dependent oxidoreductase subunit E [Clostridiales bacterium]
MNEIKHNCCCSEVSNDYSEIGSFIDRYYPGRKDGLIQILHMAQELYGCLPMDLQQFIAKKLDMPVSEIAGVVTFYSFFSMTPRGKHTIRVCLGTACYVRGGKKLVDYLLKKLEIDVGGTTEDGLFTFEIARCIGACGLAPAIMIDDDVYKQVTPAKLDSILACYKD